MHKRVWLSAAVLLALACQRPNPGYHPSGAGGRGGIGNVVGSAGTTGAAGSGGTIGIAGATGNAGRGGGVGFAGGGGIAGAGGAAGTSGVAGTGGRAATGGRAGGAGAGAAGAAGLGGRGGTGGAGGVLANCIDGDGDGYGVGAGCLGADCDDADRLVTATSARACYSGAPATRTLGACRAGSQICVAGVWGTVCNGEVLPAGESCNGQDDDCNGSVDDALATISCGLGACARQVAACSAGQLGVCIPAPAPTAAVDGCDGVDNDCDGVVDEDCPTVACVRVSQTGDDNTLDGTTMPYRSIQSAIAFATMPGSPKRVCVAGGATCGERATYTSVDGVGIVMADGVSVLGNYESTAWTRCPLSIADVLAPGPMVTIQTQTATGVEFPSTVQTPTTLDGFAFTRLAGDNLATTSAVTLFSARQVTLSNLVIADAPRAIASYGINLVSGAQALITRSIVAAGGGTTDAIAVRSAASQPILRDNCSTIDPTTGRCATSSCTGLGLRGRTTSSGSTPETSTVVDLKDSPGAIVERNAICGGIGDDLAGVRLDGHATGTVVRGNSILIQGGGDQSHGIRLDGCSDSAPWIVDNDVIAADGGSDAEVSAIRSVGACRPVIEANVRLAGGGQGAASRAVGVACGASGGIGSACTVIGNKLIQGATSGNPTQSIGIACDGGGCRRVSGNTITGNLGMEVIGVLVNGSGPLVERNTITGGCATRVTGVFAENATARIENNVVRGAACSNNMTSATAWGFHIHVTGDGSEVDVHSNTIDAGGAGACTGAAIVFGVSTSPGAGVLRRGVFRNNILRAGACNARYGFHEDSPSTDPRILQNNDFDPTGSPTALYLDNTVTALATEAQLNAFSGTQASGNISADPMFVSAPADLHPGPSSRCVDTGTTAGAPTIDFAGKVRDAKPDMGAFER